MIFGVWDYINFRRRAGRYSRSTGTNLMCGAYDRELPADVLLVLEEGDLICVAYFGWWVSWLIMYLTNSQVSHVAVYVGDGKIFHANPKGAEIAPIESLFGPNVRLLACKAPIPPEKRKVGGWRNIDPRFMQRRYSLLLVIFKGLAILSGRDVRCFRWKFFLDVAFVAVGLDAFAVLALHQPARFFWAVAGYVGLIFVNRLRWPPPRSSLLGRYYGNPGDALRWIVKGSGAFMPDPMAPWTRNVGFAAGSPFTGQIFRRKSQ